MYLGYYSVVSQKCCLQNSDIVCEIVKAGGAIPNVHVIACQACFLEQNSASFTPSLPLLSQV